MQKAGNNKTDPSLDIERLPTTSIHQARLRIFQPTRRPKLVEMIRIDTEHGSVELKKSRLGQGHADVLESLLYYSTDAGLIPGDLNPRLKVLIDPYKLRKVLGGGKACGGDYLKRLVQDIQAASLVLQFDLNGRKVVCTGHIIDETREPLEYDRPPNPLARTKGAEHETDRSLMVVVFSENWTRLMGLDVKRFYDPAAIVALPNGVAQAAARWVLTHANQPNGGWKFDTVIEAVCGELGEQARRDRRRELREGADDLAKAGVLIESDRVFRCRDDREKSPSVEHMPERVEHMPEKTA